MRDYLGDLSGSDVLLLDGLYCWQLMAQSFLGEIVPSPWGHSYTKPSIYAVVVDIVGAAVGQVKMVKKRLDCQGNCD